MSFETPRARRRAFLAAAASSVAIACSGPSHPAPIGDSDASLTSDGESPTPDLDAAQPIDAAPDGAVVPDASTDAALACNTLSAQGTAVQETTIAGSPPEATGGTIAPGRYVLTERDFYSGSGDPDPLAGTVRQCVIVFDSATMQSFEAAPSDGIHPAGQLTFSYKVPDGITLTTTESCPQHGNIENALFTVQNNELWIFAPQRRDVYVLQ
jgi:hypothetical protein